MPQSYSEWYALGAMVLAMMYEARPLRRPDEANPRHLALPASPNQETFREWIARMCRPDSPFLDRIEAELSQPSPNLHGAPAPMATVAESSKR